MASSLRRRRPASTSESGGSRDASSVRATSSASRGDLRLGRRALGYRRFFALLFLPRAVSAAINLVHDCDETFSFWEQLHYLVYGHGLQTWEHSEHALDPTCISACTTRWRSPSPCSPATPAASSSSSPSSASFSASPPPPPRRGYARRPPRSAPSPAASSPRSSRDPPASSKIERRSSSAFAMAPPHHRRRRHPRAPPSHQLRRVRPRRRVGLARGGTRCSREGLEAFAFARGFARAARSSSVRSSSRSSSPPPSCALLRASEPSRRSTF